RSAVRIAERDAPVSDDADQAVRQGNRILRDESRRRSLESGEHVAQESLDRRLPGRFLALAGKDHPRVVGVERARRRDVARVHRALERLRMRLRVVRDVGPDRGARRGDEEKTENEDGDLLHALLSAEEPPLRMSRARGEARRSAVLPSKEAMGSQSIRKASPIRRRSSSFETSSIGVAIAQRWPKGSRSQQVRSPYGSSFGPRSIVAPASAARATKRSTSATRSEIATVVPPTEAGLIAPAS